jgi:hypothetical protein
MGIPLPPAADEAEGRRLRARFGLPEGAPVIGSFGFQTPIKRTLSAVRALAAPGLERVHLLVVGEVAAVLDLEGEARRLGVAERVHVMGFVPFSDFEAAIAAVDLCLNLRYPTAGETSASLLRVLAMGRPAIVSDYAQFADLPREVALRVPLGEEEPAALAAMLRDLLAQAGRLREMGEAARRHVRLRHDPERSAEAVIAACEEWEGREPPDEGGPTRGELPPVRTGSPALPSYLRPHGEGAAAASASDPAPSSLTWGNLPGDLEVEGAEAPWRPGERRRLTLRLRNTGFARWLAGTRGAGGVALVVKLFVDGTDRLAGRPWLPLPRDLEPGEEMTFVTEVRRPPGPAHLWIEPHLFGGLGLSKHGGPRWESWI